VIALLLANSHCRAETPEPNARNDQSAAERRFVERAIARVYPALVRIHVVMVNPHNGRLEKVQGAGSGAIISRDGHIITNHHVAGKARRLVCRMPDGEEIEATLVGTDPLADICIIKLKLNERKNKDKPLPVAVFGDSDNLRVGDVVLAMGCPVAISQSVTKGIVSNTAMIVPGLFWPMRLEMDGEDVGTLVRWIGHDASISPGNSGGPLVNLDGEIVGINEISLGLAGAIPGNLAKSVADQLIHTGEVKRSWIGLECQPKPKAMASSKGVLVGGVIPDSPAAKAGIKAGDLVTSLDGVEVDCTIPEDLPVFNRLVFSIPIGKKIKITALHGNKQKTFSLTTEAQERSQADDHELKAWGITARDLTRMSALEHHRQDRKGVQVVTLRLGGPANDAKPSISEQDIILQVNDRPVDSVAVLKAITSQLTSNTTERIPVLVRFEREKKQMVTVVKIGKESEEESPGLAQKPWFPAATQVLTRDIAEILGLKDTMGVRVVQVFPGHSAESAGVKVGDILTALDGDRIKASQPQDSEVFSNMIRLRKIGAKVKFDAIRDGKPTTLTVALEEPPVPPEEMKNYKDDNFELAVRDLSFADRMAKDLPEDLKGVLVERVESAGWAAIAHISTGDILLSIDGVPVPDVATAKKILNEAETKKTARLIFFIRRGVHTIYAEVEPNWEEAR
jgi:serine protease Do